MIGDKLKIFAKQNFGTIKKLAESVDKSPQNFGQYTSNNRLPGTQLLKKLYDVGCDINWLLNDDTDEQYKIRLNISNSVNELINNIKTSNPLLNSQMNKN